jgi:DNA polymerase-3 subunit delta'
MSVFDSLIGQEHAVAEMKHAAIDAVKVAQGERGDAMTHAWLVTGPPGSGRSTIALAFAASLVCPNGGCGACVDCRNVAAGTHPDVEHVVPEGVIFTVDQTKELVTRAQFAPTNNPWKVMIMEDADRLQIDAVPRLLKVIEEPPPHTVWILCAPTVDDVLPTINSRCRHVLLNSPTLSDVATQLTNRFGVDSAMAAFAARAAQGHLGRARALATDEQARLKRSEILDIPTRLSTVSSCYEIASTIVANANAEADRAIAPLEQQDEQDVRMAFGEGAEGKGFKSIDRAIKKEMKSLEDRFKVRRRRMVADAYDRILLDLTSYYRDILVVQSGSHVGLINEELRPAIERIADQDETARTLNRIDAIREARDQLVANVTPLSVFESLLVTLRDPKLVQVGK